MKVLYVDDEQRTLDAFTSDHAKDGMSIETCLDARQVVRMLARRPSKDLPDIIVMDLYATVDQFDSDEAKYTNKRVDELVAAIANVRSELQALVRKSKSPAGIETLRDLRDCAKLKHIAVVLRTREGLALLGDSMLRDSISLGAEWMLKGRAPETERAIISRALEASRSKRRRLQRDVILMLVGTTLGAILSQILQ
jgi:CheY-like chemotaxis protein